MSSARPVHPARAVLVLAVSLSLGAAACTRATETAPLDAPSVAPSAAGMPASTAAPTTPAVAAPASLDDLRWEVLAQDFVAPVLALPRPGSAEVWVLEQVGRVVALATDGQRRVVADLEDRVAFGGERGLLGLAFAPDHESSGDFVLHYSGRGDGRTVVERWRAAGATAQPGDLVLEVAQPASNHNGGMIAFGPDGMLYLGLGDGGAADDRFGNGQRPDTLLGTILRLDLATTPYAIPADNPFVDGRTADGDAAAPEVWAYGLRNPWRFWIDVASGQLVVGDVGQNRIEEVDVLSLTEGAGANLGWPLREGNECFRGTDCRSEGLLAPITQYDHDDGCSITGGVVVRDVAELAVLEGWFLYSDFCTGFLRAVAVDDPDRGSVRDLTDVVGAHANVTSFGLDAAGTPLLLTADGTIRRLVAAD